MKSYEQALKENAMTYVHMKQYQEVLKCDLNLVRTVMAGTLAVVYEKDEDWVYSDLRGSIHDMESTIDEWYDKFCEEHVEG